ncbi:uncharacterized protein LOC124419713 [Lucilia cuprina]|uniref:uncharacterized protein LOC124419713 n=1 Tax=Lucilia cuprina TaxID=7375 RepID=UPI001F069D8D|nr:uncharacterized protein LOC124419713 [Lucilia cuprina]
MEEELFADLVEEVVSTKGDFTHKKGEDGEEEFYNLLKSWNLEHLKTFFEDERVTFGVLKIMRSGDLNDVTQKMKIGDRLIFKYNFEHWKFENGFTSPAHKYLKHHREYTSSLSCLSSQSSDEMDSLPTVLEILKQHQVGINIMEQYEKIQLLNEQHRIMIMNIIVEHFFSKNIIMTLQISYRLKNEILKLFPNEKLEYYRSERRGRLYVKYHNNKGKLKMFQTVPSSNKILDAKQKFAPEDNAELCLQSLKNDNLEDFKATWSACAKFRINQIYSGCTSIKEALAQWPQYKGSIGSQLRWIWILKSSM